MANEYYEVGNLKFVSPIGDTSAYVFYRVNLLFVLIAANRKLADGQRLCKDWCYTPG